MKSQRKQVYFTDEERFRNEINDFIEELESCNLVNFTKNKFLRKVQNVCNTIGLDTKQISAIIDILPKLKIEKPERLLPLLIPNDTVHADSVITLILWFNSLSVQSENELDTMIDIIIWIITVYPYIEKKYRINPYYDLIMHYMSSSNLCPYICHLLAFMTRAEDAKTYRVMKILRLNYNSLYMCKEFDGLLFLYKRLRSDFLNFNLSTQSNFVWFNCPNPEMQVDIYKLRMVHPNKTTRSLRWSAIFASRPIELLSEEDIEELSDELYELFDKETVEFDQPLLAQLTAMLFNRDHTSLSRTLFWLDQAICAIAPFDSNQFNTSVKLNWKVVPALPFQMILESSALIETLSSIAEFLNQSLPSLGTYFKNVLPFMRDSSSYDLIFKSLRHIDISVFSQLKSCLSEKIRSQKDKKNVTLLFKLFNELIHLLNNWLRRMNTKTIASPDKLTDSSGVLNETCNIEDSMYLFNEFVQFVFMESYEILNGEAGVEVKTAVLLLLDQIAQIATKHQLALIYLPHPDLIYKLFIDPSSVIFNLTFKLLAHYFQAFESIKVISPRVYYGSEMQGMVQVFNNIILTISSKLFPSPSLMVINKDPFHVPDIVVKHFNLKKVDNSLLLCNHLALVGFVNSYFEKTQPSLNSKNAIYHPLSIMEDRTKTDNFLKFLESRCHLTGLTSFLRLISNDSEQSDY